MSGRLRNGDKCELAEAGQRENPERTFDLVLKVKCHASENEALPTLFLPSFTTRAL